MKHIHEVIEDSLWQTKKDLGTQVKWSDVLKRGISEIQAEQNNTPKYILSNILREYSQKRGMTFGMAVDQIKELVNGLDSDEALEE